MKLLLINILLLLQFTVSASTLTGTLTEHAGQTLTVYGYNGFKNKELGKAVLNPQGQFTLNYPSNYKGMAYLQFGPKEVLFIMLTENNIAIEGKHVLDVENIVIKNSVNNTNFSSYNKQHNISENILAGLKHVLPFYKEPAVLFQQNNFKLSVMAEIKRLQQQDENFIEQLEASSFVKWYIPLRKLVESVTATAKKYPQLIPQNLQQFRTINFNHPNMVTSGLLGNLIESHYWLIENGSMPTDSMYAQMNQSTDALMASIATNEELTNTTTDFLFDFLEKRSLFKASEYLALKMLTNNSCSLEGDVAKQLETYRIMKVGNQAPPIVPQATVLKNGKELASSDAANVLNNKYTLVVFGSSGRCVFGV
jgi:hypothetical protein